MWSRRHRFNQMRQSTRLITNALATYSRMAVTFGLSLVTTRLLLQAIGITDYGIFAVLGAGISFLSMINADLTVSAQRHLAHAIGRKNPEDLNEVFNTCFGMYLVLCLLLVAVGTAIGPWLLHVLTIPADRQHAAWWVYHIMLANVALIVLGTPFQAVFAARQALVQNALFATIGSVLALAAVIGLWYLPGDQLIVYMFLLFGSRVVQFILQTVTCLVRFPESRPRPRCFRRSRLRELASFAGWSFLGSFILRLRMEGSAIVLNLFFGPTINAGFGIATQAATSHMNFSGAIFGAASPAMATMEGAGGRAQVRRLALSASKFTVLLAALWTIPILLETRQVLQLWLGHLPPYAAPFVALTLAGLMVNRLTAGHWFAIIAQGDMARAVQVISGINILPLPIAIAVFFWWHVSPVWLPALVLVTEFGITVVRATYVGQIIGLPLRDWLKGVIQPLCLPIGLGVVLACLARFTMQPSLTRLGLVTVAYIVGSGILTWRFAIAPWEREHLLRIAGNLRQKILARRRTQNLA